MDIIKAPFLCLALGACHGDADDAVSKPTRVHLNVPKGPSVSDQTRGMVDAAVVGSSKLAVTLKFDMKERPVLGRPLIIEIAVLPDVEGNPATLGVSGGTGLEVAPEEAAIDLPALEAGQVYRQPVVVTPTTDGVLVLGLNVSIHHDDTVESRAFSIPLIVDPPGKSTAAN